MLNAFLTNHAFRMLPSLDIGKFFIFNSINIQSNNIEEPTSKARSVPVYSLYAVHFIKAFAIMLSTIQSFIIDLATIKGICQDSGVVDIFFNAAENHLIHQSYFLIKSAALLQNNLFSNRSNTFSVLPNSLGIELNAFTKSGHASTILLANDFEYVHHLSSTVLRLSYIPRYCVLSNNAYVLFIFLRASAAHSHDANDINHSTQAFTSENTLSHTLWATHIPIPRESAITQNQLCSFRSSCKSFKSNCLEWYISEFSINPNSFIVTNGLVFHSSI